MKSGLLLATSLVAGVILAACKERPSEPLSAQALENCSKVKENMTFQQVRDLLGRPTWEMTQWKVHTFFHYGDSVKDVEVYFFDGQARGCYPHNHSKDDDSTGTRLR